MSNFKFLLKEKIEKLPRSAGVYAFLARRSLGEGGRKEAFLLYIGKAANIKERVRNHFQQSAFRDNLFVNQVAKIGYIKTDSEITALILEANLIKRYQPKYNVVWRDDKNYFFVGISKEDFPRIFITHQPLSELRIKNYELRIKKKKFHNSLFKIHNSKFNYVGPFVDGKALKQTLKILRKVLPYRSCYKIPNRPCLWYHLERCLAPCLLKSKFIKEIPMDSLKIKRISQRNTRNLIRILKEGENPVLKDLKREMGEVSKKQDFEEAAKIRDQITALEKVISHARIFEPQPTQQVNWPQIQKSLCQIFKINPPKFCLPDLPSATRRQAGKAKLRRARIEAYDISNIQGQEAAGSMVTFIDGKPEKSQYRRFKIRGKFTPYRNEVSGAGPNDIAMLKECLTRRLKHPEWPYPDLILIDGGRGQLNAAQSVVKYEIQNTKYKIQTMALAKKENKLFIENQKEPTLLKSLPREIFNLILQLRDEAHRFAISYHRKLRKRGLLEN